MIKCDENITVTTRVNIISSWIVLIKYFPIASHSFHNFSSDLVVIVFSSNQIFPNEAYKLFHTLATTDRWSILQTVPLFKIAFSIDILAPINLTKTLDIRIFHET